MPRVEWMPSSIAFRIYASSRVGRTVGRVLLDGHDVTDRAKWVEPQHGRVGLYEPTGRGGINENRLKIHRGRVEVTPRPLIVSYPPGSNAAAAVVVFRALCEGRSIAYPSLAGVSFTPLF